MCFDFDLKNDKLNANLKNIDIQELSSMLDYSKIFDSKATFETISISSFP